MPMYYGFHHAYGRGMRNQVGSFLGSLHVFSSIKKRDEWVASDNSCGDDRRDAISPRGHWAEREVIRNFKNGGELAYDEAGDVIHISDLKGI